METIKTLSEVYKNGSDEVKELLKKRFTDEELGIKFIPKDGDICISNYGTIFIANENIEDLYYYGVYCVLVEGKKLDLTAQIICFDRVRLATEEEKQRLFDAMREEGYQWNEEEKKLEKVLWRAKEGGWYYFINKYFSVEMTIDYYEVEDITLYKRGNYFKTREEAEKICEIFHKSINK